MECDTFVRRLLQALLCSQGCFMFQFQSSSHAYPQTCMYLMPGHSGCNSTLHILASADIMSRRLTSTLLAGVILRCCAMLDAPSLPSPNPWRLIKRDHPQKRIAASLSQVDLTTHQSKLYTAYSQCFHIGEHTINHNRFEV